VRQSTRRGGSEGAAGSLLSREPDAGLDPGLNPGLRDYNLGRGQMLNHLSHPGALNLTVWKFTNEIVIIFQLILSS